MNENNSPFKVEKVVFQRNYPGYLYRREIVDDSEHGGEGNLPMVNCYSSENGIWIGDAKTALLLCKKKGLRNLQGRSPTGGIAVIGFNESEQKWYGWSHRAICGFGLGDRIFEERFGNDDTPFVKHGKKVIKNIGQAKTAAKRFASSVS